MVPVDLEDARLVMADAELDSHPVAQEWAREVGSILHGRASHNQKFEVPLEQRKSREARLTADELAAERVERARRQAAEQRRLGALRRGSCPDRAAANDEWPF